jgi:tRNA pseudouridine13 synthase
MNKNTNRIYFNDDKILEYDFVPNRHTFYVDELSDIEFTNAKKDKNLILKIEKSYMTTIDLVDRIANKLGVYKDKIGYLGLKDKSATTTQYISIPSKFGNSLAKLAKIEAKNITILDTFKHKNALHIGDLKGNKFKIKLEDVRNSDIGLFKSRVNKLKSQGLPNYFGHQRFGKATQNYDNNFELARDIVHGKKRLQDKSLQKLLQSAYQSYFFNDWLNTRIKVSQMIADDDLSLLEHSKMSKETFKSTQKQNHDFKLFDGEILQDLSSYKNINMNSLSRSVDDFWAQKIVPTGLLPGKRVYRCTKLAREFEEAYDDKQTTQNGYRRPAWVFMKDLNYSYDKEDQSIWIEFSLPKSSYATVVIEALLNINLSHN